MADKEWTESDAIRLIDLAGSPITLSLVIGSLVSALESGPKNRPRSLAITKLEEAKFWTLEAARLEYNETKK